MASPPNLSALLITLHSRTRTWSRILVLSCMFGQIAVAQGKPLEEFLKLYDYDASAALDLQEKGVTGRDGVQVHDITYASPRGGRVPAFLVTPSGARKGAKFAGIVFLHWGQGNRSSFLADGILFAQVGAVSVMMDSPAVRPEPWRSRGGFAIPEVERDGHAQAVVDVRRAVDLLAARPDVDPKRLAYVGHSYGASLGGAVAASERRFKALVLMGGLPSWTETYRAGGNRIAAEAVRSVPRERLEKWLSIIAPLDAVNYIGHTAPHAVFFQFARFDPHVPEHAANRYFQLASEPKLMKWYDSGHEFNDPAALRDRAEWLRKQIGIGSVESVLRMKTGVR